ncbi:hypothetical protein Trco_000197 [Trichoderma cornu-damae]|uniref:Uncharacterized protein n=1 Tax=Trichoderma cornu-damae TaxID=654480 RepID=A0A9P8TZL1_9HYPO|nr:hypothetical protein Trco_000197 [Trichoderma cornu-damae]
MASQQEGDVTPETQYFDASVCQCGDDEVVGEMSAPSAEECDSHVIDENADEKTDEGRDGKTDGKTDEAVVEQQQQQE